jgi:hypothetical protein
LKKAERRSVAKGILQGAAFERRIHAGMRNRTGEIP